MKKFLKYMIGAWVFLAMVGVLIMLLWNALVPTIFGLPKVSFIQSAGLFMLSSLLFREIPKVNE